MTSISDVSLRAITVSVDYADLLSITLPYNRHHFSEIMVVSTHTDQETKAVAAEYDARLFCTSAFYDDGADFNKWKALEQALDSYGRHGWLCILDADVLWPKEIIDFGVTIGNLYTPLCYWWATPTTDIPAETDWPKYEIRQNVNEWAGYTQIFHAEDQHLPKPPWHQVDWRHAGGGDSFFQFNWPHNNKLRPPFNVFHLGLYGRNWCGRATPYLDGTEPEGGRERYEKLCGYRNERGKHRNFEHERLGVQK